MELENRIESVKIQGFRSLKDVELNNLPNAAVLIGPNGSGKSNFIRFFEMLSSMLSSSQQLGVFVARQGGADDQLFGGNVRTSRMVAEIIMQVKLNMNREDYSKFTYKFTLTYGHPDRLIFTEEAFRFTRFDRPEEAHWQYLESGHREANLVLAAHTPGFLPEVSSAIAQVIVLGMAQVIVHLLRNCAVYQFHDTSESSKFKQGWDVGDKYQLLSHGGNLAAVLYRLEQEDVRRYELICKQIGRVLPGFERFAIEEEYSKVILRWKAKWSDKIIGAHLTSDGSLRFFALVTLLNLPPEMLPDVILLDEPELGLHPAAIALLGGMIKSLSTQKQVIVATQSPLLVDSFNLDEIFVLELKEGETKVIRPNEEELHHWLEEYSTGELWQKNLLGGRP